MSKCDILRMKGKLMEPLVSIITPTLNIVEKNQVDEFNLLVSLLEMQTYPRIEHIIVDGASTDETIELLKDYKNKGYISFYSERDTGKFHALNKGIMRAKGKYISFISCDDFYHDITAIYDAVNTLEAENADFIFSPAYCRHPENYTFLFTPAMYNAFQVMPCARQGMMFKRSMMEEEKYFDEKFKLMSDLDFIIRILMKKRKGIYFDTNYTTYKLSEKTFNNEEQCINETKLIYRKNFKNLYPLDDDTLDAMARYSEFPQPLLEKLSECFVPEDKELFFERCEQMHKIRLESYKNRRQ